MERPFNQENGRKGFIKAGYIFFGSMIIPLVLIALAQLVFSSAPNTLAFNGKITNFTTGAIIQGNANFTAKIFNVPSGGTQLFTEDHNNTFVDKGVFSLLIGKTSGVNVTFNESLWLELVVNGETLAPRINLTSAAYSYSSRSASQNFNFGSFNASNVSAINPSDGTNLSVDSGTLFVDSSNNRVGIGTTQPGMALMVVGNVNVSGTINGSMLNVSSLVAFPGLSGTPCDTIDTSAAGVLSCGTDDDAPEDADIDWAKLVDNATIVTTSAAAGLNITNGPLRVTSGIDPAGYATGQGDLYVGGNVEIDGSLNISVAVADILRVCSGACGTLNDVGVAGDLYVEGNAEVDGALNVTGAGTFTGRLSGCSGDCGTRTIATAAGDIFAEDDVEVDGNINVSGVDTSNRIRLVEQVAFVAGSACAAGGTCTATCATGYTIVLAGFADDTSTASCSTLPNLIDGDSSACGQGAEKVRTCLGKATCSAVASAGGNGGQLSILCLRVGQN